MFTTREGWYHPFKAVGETSTQGFSTKRGVRKARPAGWPASLRWAKSIQPVKNRLIRVVKTDSRQGKSLWSLWIALRQRPGTRRRRFGENAPGGGGGGRRRGRPRAPRGPRRSTRRGGQRPRPRPSALRPPARGRSRR